MIAAMAVAAGAAFAETAPITSANVVGFVQNENAAEESQTFIGASFFNVNGESEVLPFSKLNCAEGFEDGDQIQTAFITEDGLIDFNFFDYDSFEGGWCQDGDLVDDDMGLELGQGAWLVTSEAKHLISSGQVKSNNKVRTLTESQQVISSLYPVPFCPNGPNVSWNVEDGAQIQVAFITDEGLIDFNFFDYDSFEGGWCQDGDLLNEDFAVVQAGEGFWLVLGDSFADYDFTEVSPLYVESAE